MNIRIKDEFWNRYCRLVKDEMIPFQWSVLNDEADIVIEKENNSVNSPSEKSHAIENFKIAAGLAEGRHYGWVFQDSDVYKWLEAVAYSLENYPDEELLKKANDTVELIAKAQAPDGYIHTKVQIDEPEMRYKRLAEYHELYCMGHLLEAMCAFYRVTENKVALDIAVKCADHICDTYKVGGIEAAGGHEEVEVGLMKLYHLTGDKRYMNEAEFMLRVRGKSMEYYKKQAAEDPHPETLWGVARGDARYLQCDMEVTDQTAARGHAVRQVYMLEAMADLAASGDAADMRDTSERMWDDIVNRQMYITGGVGSQANGECFTEDYDLPDDTMYCESCASVAMVFYAHNMLKISPRGEYADILEKELYNTCLAGFALDGRHFFYVNPLAVDPVKIKTDKDKGHVKAVRPSWLGCACCPPNLARLMADLPEYIYTVKDDVVLSDLFIGNEAEFELKAGKLSISLSTDYPENGHIRYVLNGPAGVSFGIRIPAYADRYSLVIDSMKVLDEDTDKGSFNGKEISYKDGYVFLEGGFDNTEIELNIAVHAHIEYPHPKIKAVSGKAAVVRGPFVYCLEERDNGKGLESIGIGKAPVFADDKMEICDLPIHAIKTKGIKEDGNEAELTFIPYYAWANRGENEMRVYLKSVNQ